MSLFFFVDVHCHFFEFVVTHCILFYFFPIEINTTYILLYTEHINIYYFLIRISKKNRKHNCQKKKGQKDIQRSTKHTYKTKDRVARTPLKPIN